jgi:hypothetical protein
MFDRIENFAGIGTNQLISTQLYQLYSFCLITHGPEGFTEKKASFCTPPLSVNTKSQ